MQLRSLEMKKVMATLRAIVEVMESLSKDADPDGVGRLIIEEVHAFCMPTFNKLFSTLYYLRLICVSFVICAFAIYI